ncbi:MAG TPA: sigma-70 family RNA polymerase sigma factor [Verrucomicrobiae bacterium]|nr:sigma-70 family RNA polymerase sigma factor [Verrucomicrobiae bacterium]
MDSLGENINDATSLLQPVERGDSHAAESLLAIVYDELRRLAAYKMAHEAPGQTLQPTALVHEAWLKLVGIGQQQFKNRAHFFAVAAEAMRRILIDRARRRQTQRHGGRFERVELEETELEAPAEDDQLFAVNDALEKFSRENPIQAQVVKLRYFGGMTNEEIAQALGLSVSTVKTYWVFARAWLFDAIRNS